MFPNARLGQAVVALGTLFATLALLLPTVTFRLTDLGFAHHGRSIMLVSDDVTHVSTNGTVVHVGGCKFVGANSICSHKQLSYDQAHGLRLVGVVTSRPPSGI